MMNLRGGIKVALLLTIAAFCLFEFMLCRHGSIFRVFEATLLSLQWMLLVCITVWCACFLFLTFSLNDLPLIGLLLIVIAVYFIGYTASSRAVDAILLLFCVTLGKGARFFLKAESGNFCEIVNRKSAIVNFLVGLVVLLVFSSWWHVDMTNNFYHGPRWMGLWNNPNIYGMLMGAGVVLAVGLLIAAKEHKEHKENFIFSLRPFLRSLRSFAAKNMVGKRRRRGGESHSENGRLLKDSLRRPLPIILFIAAGMMGVGLLFSYSRGAWVGTTVGLLYLAKAYGKFKWRFVLAGILVVAVVGWFFWNTPRTAPWYFQRLDFSRGSVQHRVATWRGAFQMMRDYPFGAGWNRAVDIYQKNYSRPENGAGAIITNDYLMLGTQLGLPALLCFVAYVGLALKGERRKEKAETLQQIGNRKSEIRWPVAPALWRCS